MCQGQPYTHIAKVEIVVSSTQNPDRVARCVADKIGRFVIGVDPAYPEAKPSIWRRAWSWLKAVW